MTFNLILGVWIPSPLENWIIESIFIIIISWLYHAIFLFYLDIFFFLAAMLPNALSCFKFVSISSVKEDIGRVGDLAICCRLKALVFKWQEALFPPTLSQISRASQVCLWEKEGEKIKTNAPTEVRMGFGLG